LNADLVIRQDLLPGLQRVTALHVPRQPWPARPREIWLHGLSRRAGASHRHAERAWHGVVLAGAAAAQGIRSRLLRAVS
jgi:hypothetical protein